MNDQTTKPISKPPTKQPQPHPEGPHVPAQPNVPPAVPTEIPNVPGQPEKLPGEHRPDATVKIFTNRAISVDEKRNAVGIIEGTIIAAGVEIHVTPAEARRYCGEKFRGYYAFSGERGEDVRTHDLRRAEVVREKRPLDEFDIAI